MTARAEPSGAIRCGALPGWAREVAKGRDRALALGFALGEPRILGYELSGSVWVPEQAALPADVGAELVSDFLERAIRHARHLERLRRVKRLLGASGGAR